MNSILGAAGSARPSAAFTRVNHLVKKSIRPGSKIRITVGHPCEKRKTYMDYTKRIDNLVKEICMDLESAVYDFPADIVSLSVIDEGSNLEIHHFIHGPVFHRDYDASPCSN
jgi:hypothetical protein